MLSRLGSLELTSGSVGETRESGEDVATVERVETAHDFQCGLESDPDLILGDFKLPQFDIN
jgi:hypothetical protein